MEVSSGEGAVLLGMAVVVDVSVAFTRDVDVVVQVQAGWSSMVMEMWPVVVVDDRRGKVAALTLSYGLVNWC